jgi:hypothetical protein
VIHNRELEGRCDVLQDSSGAHPRYARNPGTAEDPYQATSLRTVDIEVLPPRRTPPALILSVAAAQSRRLGV